MGFLRTNDLSEIKSGELNLDFGVWLKTGKWFENWKLQKLEMVKLEIVNTGNGKNWKL